ncbi:MAG TPA: DUF1501 domain-containing protein [Pirellulales bacterium]|jgi:hypothetical protein|nr:DUF1501 domain-containing protein [Pirellulales bacterium]
MASHIFCDGLRRRDFIKVGALGGLGLHLAGYLRLAEAGQVAPAKGRSAIYIYLQGGPSHQDMFDLKPEAPAEYRGEFKPIKTNVPGIEICEHLPKLAKCADKFTILRGVSHTLGAHNLGTDYMNTGNRPLRSLDYPGYGAVISRELPVPKELPSAVAIPSTTARPGYLGVQYATLETSAVPMLGKPFAVRGISLSRGLTVADMERRHHLLDDLDTTFKGYERNSDVLQGLDKFDRQAYDIVSSPAARKAFDTSLEPAAVAEKFGNHAFGQSCLLATRLVEAGVRFVTINYGGWDTHGQNFKALKERKLPEFDDGFSALLTNLSQRGLLDSTSVFVTGEFGRTPKINPNAGRDHWPQAMFTLLAGGGMKIGQVIGASDEKAAKPKDRAISPDDVAASFYRSLGIDYTKEYRTPTGRPVMIVRNGTPVPELFG